MLQAPTSGATTPTGISPGNPHPTTRSAHGRSLAPVVMVMRSVSAGTAPICRLIAATVPPLQVMLTSCAFRRSATIFG